MDITSINVVLAVGTILSQIFIVAAIVYFLFFKKEHSKIGDFFAAYGMLFAFVVALAAMFSSLFYSEIAGFAPCVLCWYQRVFMYPEVFLLLLALIKKDKNIIDYSLLLAACGLFISLYQVFISDANVSTICQVGSSVSCSQQYVLQFGYVTIPVMSATAFLMIVVLLLFPRLKK